MFEDEDFVEEPFEFFLFMPPVTNEVSTVVVASPSMAEIDRDPDDTPRSRRIVEVVKQNFDIINDQIEVLQSVQQFGNVTKLFDEAGTHYWTCPAGVTRVYAEAIGAGGDGHARYIINDAVAVKAGAGGGGGGYAAGYVNVTPGETYAVIVPSHQVPPIVAYLESATIFYVETTDIPYAILNIASSSYTSHDDMTLDPNSLPTSLAEFRGDDGQYVQASSGYPGGAVVRYENGYGSFERGIGGWHGEGIVGDVLRNGGYGGNGSIGGGGGGGAGGDSTNGGNGGVPTSVLLQDGITLAVGGGASGTSGGTDSGAGGVGGSDEPQLGVLVPTAGESVGGGGGGASRQLEPSGGVEFGSAGGVRLTWEVQVAPNGDYGDITVAGNVWTIDAGAVTLAKMADMAAASLIYRKTAGSGAPEVNTLATLKTDLGLSGTNTGDQTSVSGNAGTATALETARNINGVSFNGTANITVPPGIGVIILEDQKSSGTNGGDFTSGAWQTRTLNTEVVDTGGDCSLSSNQFTLTAGTYELQAWAPGAICANHQARLQNVTDTATIATGSTEFSDTTNAQTSSMIVTRFTIAASKALEIQHRCNTTAATFGFGAAASFGTEVYTRVFIRRVA